MNEFVHRYDLADSVFERYLMSPLRLVPLVAL